MSSLKPFGSRQTAVVRRLDLGEGIQLQVLLKNLSSESHIILAVNLKGYTVLHWGVSRTSAGEWLVSGEGNKIEICKWLLDEIAQREKDAERSLMHR
ncbi:hypothetical protein B296_00024946 [Ensete ventricosum]|uniref:Alpha-glucan water dikinase-like N-terminal Ig-like domain-containing protein n=1 Tax=Ensete ventricosum TaxID=4639 RepID=A0A427AU10_ENSVE|nr:hypothetical protein B296_00024946 [Ensete ventricosum]